MKLGLEAGGGGGDGGDLLMKGISSLSNLIESQNWS